MKNIWNWVKKNPNRTMFLIPIILVAGISISHVVAWYDIANPISWAIYLSIAIEIGAMTALVAAMNKIKGGVWFMFGLVTFVQMIGNIFFSFKEVDPESNLFKSWIELTGPVWESIGSDPKDIIAMKRWLAFLEGGLLPIISLTSLHFFIKYDDGSGNKIKIFDNEETENDKIVSNEKNLKTDLETKQEESNEVNEEKSDEEKKVDETTSQINEEPLQKNETLDNQPITKQNINSDQSERFEKNISSDEVIHNTSNSENETSQTKIETNSFPESTLTDSNLNSDEQTTEEITNTPQEHTLSEEKVISESIVEKEEIVSTTETITGEETEKIINEETEKNLESIINDEESKIEDISLVVEEDELQSRSESNEPQFFEIESTEEIVDIPISDDGLNSDSLGKKLSYKRNL